MSEARACGDETARGALVVAGRLELAALANWSRDGVARSFGFRRVPLPLVRDSRDAEVRTELERGTGSRDDGAGSFDNREIPVDLGCDGSSIFGSWLVEKDNVELLKACWIRAYGACGTGSLVDCWGRSSAQIPARVLPVSRRNAFAGTREGAMRGRCLVCRRMGERRAVNEGQESWARQKDGQFPSALWLGE